MASNTVSASAMLDTARRLAASASATVLDVTFSDDSGNDDGGGDDDDDGESALSSTSTDAVATATAVTQTSGQCDVVRRFGRFDSDTATNSFQSACGRKADLRPKQLQSCQSRRPQQQQQQTSSQHHHNRADHLTPTYRQRMTADDSSSAPDEDDEDKFVKQIQNNRSTSVSRRETSADSIMNLRNRPLKAATADQANIGNSNSSPSSTTTVPSKNLPQSTSITTEKSVRVRTRRLQHKASCDQYANCTNEPLPSPSIRSFFPLRTIGSVCELFRSQISPDSLSHPSSSNRNEPNLALLSIVIGIVEESITNGTFNIDEEDSLRLFNLESADEMLLMTNSIYSSLINNNGANSNVRNRSGSYSPAEATPAPTVESSNSSNTSPFELPIPTVQYETVETLLNQFTTQIKESIDLSKYPKKTSCELIKKISDVVWSNLHRSNYKDRAHLQTLYSYLTGNKLDCYGVAYTVIAACQVLGLDDVRLVMSEDHAWVVFGDNETCQVTWHGKGNEDKCGQPVPVNTDSWIYLNGNTMVCDKYLTVATLVSAMNPSINATQDSEELAILQQQLLWILYDYGHLSQYPMALGNLGDLEDVCMSGMARKEPLELFNEAIESAKKYYKDSHVYPYTYLGGYFFRVGRFKDALRSWADAAQVMIKYNYSRDDEEIYKEFQEIANDLIPHIVKFASNNLIEPSSLNSVPLLQDAECFAYLLRFYDSLCSWEEGSSTPVLHIGWTKPIVATISKFSHTIRSQVVIKVDDSRNSDVDSENEEYDNDDATSNGRHSVSSSTIGDRRRRRAASAGSINSLHDDVNNENNCHNVSKVVRKESKIGIDTTHTKDTDSDDGDVKLLSYNHHLADTNIKSRITKPNSSPAHHRTTRRRTSESLDYHQYNNNHHHNNCDSYDADQTDCVNDADKEDFKSASVMLTSKKFAGLKNLLTADKLNTSAIQLQLTAQSQVNVNKRNRNGSSKIGASIFSEPPDYLSTTTASTLSSSSRTPNNNNASNKRVRRD